MKRLYRLLLNLFEEEGRLIYIGAGTSGRLGILDAVECPPTFGTDDKMVQGFIAGGLKAFTKAVEGAEDREELAEEDLKSIGLNEKDTVIGILKWQNSLRNWRLEIRTECRSEYSEYFL